MTKVRAKIFTENCTQTIRLPEAVAFPESVRYVDVLACGVNRLITPAGGGWDSWFDGPSVTDDFMPDRQRQTEQRRDDL